ncbi:hypothetical protein N7466_000106 [Penicillium verhagenii]|uniref:uncharacterized protein n=1 Tax=Penicillium verhagenii TaxID=1562060 RepID=UPI002544F293|nr:uncharacterized protein N7466_000106 [Penicillium verhagenii]KAJ5947091.1 hypothetical protein N7466_000106 [Penicillium verhagenii]
MQAPAQFQWELEEMSNNQFALTRPIALDSAIDTVLAPCTSRLRSMYLSIAGKGYLAGYAWQIANPRSTSRIDPGAGRLAPGGQANYTHADKALCVE